MLKQRAQYDDEFKKNAVKLSYASLKPVRAIADDLGAGYFVLIFPDVGVCFFFSPNSASPIASRAVSSACSSRWQ